MAKYDKLQTIGFLFSIYYIFGNQVNISIAQEPVNAQLEAQTIRDPAKVLNSEQSLKPTNGNISTNSSNVPLQPPHPRLELPPPWAQQPYHHPSSSHTGYLPLNSPPASLNAFPSVNKQPPLPPVPPVYPPISQHPPPSIPNGHPSINQHHPVAHSQIHTYYLPAYPYHQYPQAHPYPAAPQAHPYPAAPPAGYYPPPSDVRITSPPQPTSKSIDTSSGEFHTLEEFLRRQHHFQIGLGVPLHPTHHHFPPPPPHSQQIVYRELQQPHGYPSIGNHSLSFHAQRNVAAASVHTHPVAQSEIPPGSVPVNSGPFVQPAFTKPKQEVLVDIKPMANQFPKDALPTNQELPANLKTLSQKHRPVESVRPTKPGFTKGLPQGLPVIPRAVLVETMVTEIPNIALRKSSTTGHVNLDNHSKQSILPKFQQHPKAHQQTPKGIIINSTVSIPPRTEVQHPAKTDLSKTTESLAREDFGGQTVKSLVEVLHSYNPSTDSQHPSTAPLPSTPNPTSVPTEYVQDQNKSINLENASTIKTPFIPAENFQSTPSHADQEKLAPQEMPIHQHPVIKEISHLPDQAPPPSKSSTQIPNQQSSQMLSHASDQQLSQLLTQASNRQLSKLLSQVSNQQLSRLLAEVSNQQLSQTPSQSPTQQTSQSSILVSDQQTSQLSSHQSSLESSKQSSDVPSKKSSQMLPKTSHQQLSPLLPQTTDRQAQQRSTPAITQQSTMSPYLESPNQSSQHISLASPQLLPHQSFGESFQQSSQMIPETPTQQLSKLFQASDQQSPQLFTQVTTQKTPKLSSKPPSMAFSKQSLKEVSNQQQLKAGNISQRHPSSQQKQIKNSATPSLGTPNKLQTIEIPPIGSSHSKPGYVSVIYIPGPNDSPGKSTGFFRVIHVSVPTVSKNKSVKSGALSKGTIGLTQGSSLHTSPSHVRKSGPSSIQKYLGLTSGDLVKTQGNTKNRLQPRVKSTPEFTPTTTSMLKVKSASESLPNAMKKLVKFTKPVQSLNGDHATTTSGPISQQPTELHSASLLNAKLKKYMQFVKLQQQREAMPQTGRISSRSKTEQYKAFLELHEKQMNPQLQTTISDKGIQTIRPYAARIVPTTPPFTNKGSKKQSSVKSAQSVGPEPVSLQSVRGSQSVSSSSIPVGEIETMIAHSGVDRTSKLLNRTEPMMFLINKTKVEEAIRQKHTENILHIKNSTTGPNTSIDLNHLTLGKSPSQTNKVGMGLRQSTHLLNSTSTSSSLKANDTLPGISNYYIPSTAQSTFPTIASLNPDHYQTNSYMTTYRHIIIRENGSVPIPRLPNETSDSYGNPSPIPNQFPNNPILPRGSSVPGSLYMQTQLSQSQSVDHVNSPSSNTPSSPLRNGGRATIISNMANPGRQHQAIKADAVPSTSSLKAKIELNNKALNNTSTRLFAPSAETVKLSARFNLQAKKFAGSKNSSKDVGTLFLRNVITIPGNISLKAAHPAQVTKSPPPHPNTGIAVPIVKMVSSPPVQTHIAAAEQKASHVANHPVIQGSHPHLTITSNATSGLVSNTSSSQASSMNMTSPNALLTVGLSTPKTLLKQASPNALPTAGLSPVSINTVPPALPSSTVPPTTTAPPFPADLMCTMQSDCEVGCCYTMSGEILWDWKFMMNPPPPASQVGYCHVKTVTLAGDSCHEQHCPCSGGNQVCSSIPPANFTLPAGFDPSEAGPMSFGKCYENGPQLSVMSHLEKAKQIVDLCMVDPSCPLYQPAK